MDEIGAGDDDSSSDSKRLKHQEVLSTSILSDIPEGKVSTGCNSSLPRASSSNTQQAVSSSSKQDNADSLLHSDSEVTIATRTSSFGSFRGNDGQDSVDNRSLLSLPSMYSSSDEENDRLGELGNYAADHFSAIPQRSLSVDGGMFAAERAEEDAEEEKSRRRVNRFRQVLAKRAKVLQVNPRTRTRVTTTRALSIQAVKVRAERDGVDSTDNRQLEGSTASSEEEPFSLWNVSRQDKLMLMALFLVDLSVFMSLSVMAPFFPQEAASKGLSSTLSGWVFGVFALVQCIMSPVFGLMIPHVGPRFLFLAGQFFAGGCSILFGLLTYVPTEESNVVYIVLCFTLRISLAMGCTACSTASFAATASQFSDGATQVFGILEMGAGLGLMAGPALGGVLYEFGGFAAPFALLGVFLLLTVPMNYVLLPPYTAPTASAPGSSVSMLQMLSIPAVAVVCLATFTGSVAWSIMDPTLAPHFEVFGLSPSMLGLVFLLMSAFYAISSPFWGWSCDKVEDSSPLLCLGFAVCTVGFLLLGPSPLLGFPKDYNTLWLNLVSLSVLGLSISLAVIPTYDKLLDAAEKAGIEEGIEMYSVIAGLWSAVYALGDFAGPTLGGILLDKVGFPWTMTYTAIGCGLMTVIIFVLWIFELRHGPTQMSYCCRRRHATKHKALSIEDGMRTVGTDERTPLLAERT